MKAKHRIETYKGCTSCSPPCTGAFFATAIVEGHGIKEWGRTRSKAVAELRKRIRRALPVLRQLLKNSPKRGME